MGKIIREKYPELSDHDQEAIRQQAIAAMTLTQQAKAALTTDANGELKPTTAFIDGVRKFALSVPDLAIDPIGRASCRERVCKSVEISVVAVTLIKKYTIK